MQKSKLYGVIEPAVSALGFKLWGFELIAHGNSSTLRVYLDDEQGVSLEACAKVSRQVSAVLDVEDPIAGAYRLEVSSPGMDRPLFTEEQFARFVGETVKCRLRMAKNGQRNYRGVIESVENEQIQLKVDDAVLAIKINEIDRANVVPQF